MWLFLGFKRLLVGFWRLLIGLVIGAIAYVWLFFNYKGHWENIHEATHDLLSWLVASPYLADYSQWNTLLNLDDKLAFALFIMAGRIIWLVIENVFFTFPYWLILGRNKKKEPVRPGGEAQMSESMAIMASGQSPTPAQPAVPQTSVPPVADPAPMTPPPVFSATPTATTGATGTLAAGLANQAENAGNLEHSIDEALARIKKIGELNSKT